MISKIHLKSLIAGEDIFLNYYGILGMDFLHQYRVKIDFESMRLTSLLPAWHNLYEMPERQKFECENGNIEAHKFNDMLVYTEKNASDKKASSSITVGKSLNGKKQHKLSTMDAKINRLTLVPTDTQTNKNVVKIMPFSVRNFKIKTCERVICRAKTFHDGVFCNDTIIDKEHNTISVALENYSVYRFTQSGSYDENERITKILSGLDISHCSE